jgi:transposase
MFQRIIATVLLVVRGVEGKASYRNNRNRLIWEELNAIRPAFGKLGSCRKFPRKMNQTHVLYLCVS